MFSISSVDYRPPHPVTYLVTSNNILVMALDNSHIIRLDLADPSELEGALPQAGLFCDMLHG